MKTFNKKNIYTFIMLCVSLFSSAQIKSDDGNILEKYIASKGYNSSIGFDASNIKQFWIDNTVVSINNTIRVLLNSQKVRQRESIPLKIQLVNLLENQDCHIDIITENSDLSFLVTDTNNKTISSSTKDDDFIQDHVLTSTFHLEDTQNFTFNLVFQSKTLSEILIKKIILSFSRNKDSRFLVSPGLIEYEADDFVVELSKGDAYHIDQTENDIHSFSLTGKGVKLLSKKRILVSDNAINNSVKVKNIGKDPVRIYYGYVPYTKDQRNIHNRNNPYDNSILKVLSSEDNSNRIIVDSYPKWKESCYLVLNAKEDLSDFPNFSFVGPIQTVNKLDNSQAEIILESPLKKAIKTGTDIRIHSPYGSMYIYTHSMTLKPEEELTLSSSKEKDDSFLQYSSKAFCRGTHYVIPVLWLESTTNEESTVLISNYSVSY